MSRPLIALASTIALLLTLAVGVLAGAQEGRRATASIRAGGADLTAHACNLWGCEPHGNVYLAQDDDPAALALRPPDGPVLAVGGCVLRDSTYDVIQALDPAGVVALGAVCQEVLDEAAMTPEERQALHAPEYDEARRPMWDRVMQCEAGSAGAWSANTGNGYYGGLQFSVSSWNYVGGQEFAPYPHQATAEQQIVAGERLLATAPYDEHWPVCGDEAGLVRR